MDMKQQQQTFADMFKAFGEFKPPSFDFNNLFSAQRRNIEALTEAGQIISESAKSIVGQQVEAARSNVEALLSTSKEAFTGSSPEENTSRQAELTRNILESSVSNLRDTVDSVTKSQFEAFDVLQKRLAENIEEISSAAAGSGKSGKKKAA